MSKRRRPKSVNGDRQSNREATAAGRNGQQSQTPQGPIETVVVQGPTAMPAPVDADEPGRANSSSLPSAAVIGSTSEPERTSEQNTTSTQATGELRTGGLGAVARTAPTIVHGIRDLRMIKHLAARPDWQMPAGYEASLPLEAFLIAKNLRRDGSKADYSPHMQVEGMQTLMRMEESNRRKITMSVRLRQLDRQKGGDTHLHQHLHEGNKCVIVLPETADLSEFAVIDAEPSGNGIPAA